jgi:sterol desaturase/sphingolipid hydroxylase (fatty acid hydroxylase superfamily)
MSSIIATLTPEQWDTQSVLPFVATFVYLYISGTVVFDLAHYLLHRWSHSQWRILRGIAYMHQVHHYFYSRSLKYQEKYRWLNVALELPLELACQAAGTAAAWWVLDRATPDGSFWGTHAQLYTVLAFSAVRTMVVMWMEGEDSNHIAYNGVVPKDPAFVTVGPEYHALHHVYPDRYYSSAVRIFDWTAGTAYSLTGKRITVTGGSGAFGSAMIKTLQAENPRSIQTLKYGRDWTHDSFDKAIPALEQTDILILAHGAKGSDAMAANCTSSVSLIDLFLSRRVPCHSSSKTLPEVWYVGSEIEIHPAFGAVEYAQSKRAFLPHAKALYNDERLVYRHIVPAAFESPMGKAIVSADWAAQTAMWWIRRGARYVPVTYTGLAYLNYFKFVWWQQSKAIEAAL